jgi:hypothetical protein
MIGLKKASVAAVSVALLVVVVSAFTPRAGFGQGNGNGNGNGQQPQKVLVVNPQSAPLPIVGSVRTFDGPRVAFESRLQLSFNDGDNQTGGDFDPVPAGKQLVVTFASGFAHVSTATSASFRILKTGLSLSTVAIHQLKPVATGTVQGIVAGEPLQIIVNPGERLIGIIARNSLTGNDADNGMSISGYLVDLP